MTIDDSDPKYNRFNIVVERKTVIKEEVCISVDVPTFISYSLIRKGYTEELIRSKAHKLDWTALDRQDTFTIRDNMMVSEAEAQPHNVFLNDEEKPVEEPKGYNENIGVQRIDVESGQITYLTTLGKPRILNVLPETAVKIKQWKDTYPATHLADAVPELTLEQRNMILGVTKPGTYR